ncbi:MAG: AlpA family phage regulatory protein [Pseudomonadota bacterium]
MNQPQMLNAREAAQIVGISCSSVHRLTREGRFPSPVRLLPQRIAWKRDEVEAWLQERLDGKVA